VGVGCGGGGGAGRHSKHVCVWLYAVGVCEVL
jgi:hypothetical protein